MSMLVSAVEEETFKTLDEMSKYIDDHPVSVVSTDSPSSIQLNRGTDGELLVGCAGVEHQFAERGFDRFCDLISVPKKFVKALPFDNVVKDLYASIISSALSRLSFLIKDNLIVGVSHKEDPVIHREVMDAAFSTNHKEIKDLHMSNDQLVINFTRDSEQPIAGEIVDTGISLCHDIGINPVLGFYFWRQICSNGAVARELFKIGKFSGRMKKNRMLEVFRSRIDESLDEGNSILCSSIQNMNEREVEEDEKKYLNKYLSKKLSFGEHSDGPTKFEAQIIVKDATYYDLLNFITDFAKGFGLSDKYRIEGLGGDMVSHFRDVKPTSELFKGYSEFKRKMIHKEQSV